ncbi:MAG: DUF2341 domain-containing protein [Candidatus Micrarchaeota archaeon]
MKVSKKKPLRKASAKAQSAMEYLMTYGWAILIVAVVLGALYSLGVFNGAAFLGTSCVSASGFYCTNPTLSTGGVLTVTIGQATGTTFKNAYLYFVPSGTNFSTSDPSTSIGTLNSGQQVTVSIPLVVGSPYPAAYTLGTPISGYLYLQFTDIYGTTEVNKIATVLTKVTATSSVVLSQQASIPSGIVAYVPITLTNSQSSATPSPFQQMIQINEGNYANYIAYNGNIANFEFYTRSGQILPAWIESNNSGTLTVWVKLPNGIPASSSLTIYLGFANKTTNLLSSSGTSGIGEAPQLSSTYAQYDDGASVFNNYWNFAGTSLPSGLTETVLSNPSGASGSYSVNNGITISNTNGTDFWNSDYMITLIYDTSTISIPSIVQARIASLTGNSGEGGWAKAGVLYQNSITDSSTSNGEVDMEVTAGNGYAFQWQTGTSYIAPSANNNGGSINYSTVVSLVFSSTSSVGGFYGSSLGNLTQMGSYETPTSIASSGYIGLLITTHSSGTSSAAFQYLLTRAYPPNGVMPSVSFGLLKH